MSTYPEINAGYEAAKRILDGKDVTIRHLGQLPRASSDPIAMIAASPAAYSVEGVALREGINLCRNTRFGFDAEWLMVDYPTDVDHSEFEEKLREVLVPAVDGLLQRAAEDREARTSEPGPHEAVDAVTRLT